MVALEIYINGEKRFTAGGEDFQTVNALVGLFMLPLPKPDDTNVSLLASALTPGGDRVATWPSLDVAVGDRVEIRIVDVSVVDAPESVQTVEKSDDIDA